MVTPAASNGDNTVGWLFDNTYSRLPDVFFAPAKPAKMRAPRVSILMLSAHCATRCVA